MACLYDKEEGSQSKGNVMDEPGWKLENNTVTVSLPTTPACSLAFSTTEVDKVIENLGLYRNHMLPPVPIAYDAGRPVTAALDPAWRIDQDLMSGETVLHLRDPRFGWLHFKLPAHEAEKMGHYLTMHARDKPMRGVGGRG